MTSETKSYNDLEFKHSSVGSRIGADIEYGSLDGQELILYSNTRLDEGGYKETGITVCYTGPNQLAGEPYDMFFFGAEELFSGSANDFMKFMLKHPIQFVRNDDGKWVMEPEVLKAWRHREHVGSCSNLEKWLEEAVRQGTIDVDRAPYWEAPYWTED